MASDAMDVEPAEEKKLFVFTARGHQPDVRLRVFDIEYHVHSVILKLYSAYFFKFLDSPEKQSRMSPTSRFRYEWVTRVDAVGSWCLESVGPDKQDLQTVLTHAKCCPPIEKTLFHKMMCSFYGTSYVIEDVLQLMQLTDMANYYCALPRLSSTVMGAISTAFLGRSFWDLRHHVLPALFKLRRTELFRDCVIIIAGMWNQVDYEKAVDELPSNLRPIVESARNVICRKIVAAHQEYLEKGRAHSEYRKVIKAISRSSTTFLPQYYRAMANLVDEHLGSIGKMPALETLMGSELTRISDDDESGDEELPGFFLCGNINEQDLPWDVNQTDW